MRLSDYDLEYIVSNSKWPIRYSDYWNRYIVLLFPFFLFVLSLVMPVGLGLTVFNIVWLITLFSSAVYLFIYHFKRIKTERKFYSIPVTVEQFNNLENFIKELGWECLEKNEQAIIATTKTSCSSWGDRITIILKEKEKLFNSRPEVAPNSDNRSGANFWTFYNLLTNPKPG